MQLPNKVTILGVPFKVVRGKLTKSHGETFADEHLIKLDKKLQGDALKSTLIHEIIHAILYVAGQSERLSEEQEEGIVIALEHGLAPIMSLTLDTDKEIC